MTTVESREYWVSPAGRVHLRQSCSGNGRPRETRRVWLTLSALAAYDAEQKLCVCARRWLDNSPPSV